MTDLGSQLPRVQSQRCSEKAPEQSSCRTINNHAWINMALLQGSAKLSFVYSPLAWGNASFHRGKWKTRMIHGWGIVQCSTSTEDNGSAVAAAALGCSHRVNPSVWWNPPCLLYAVQPVSASHRTAFAAHVLSNRVKLWNHFAPLAIESTGHEESKN